MHNGKSESIKEDYSVRKNWDEVFIVDPLDGTKEFINGSPQYGVNIALCRKGSPVFGVIYLPEDKALYFGTDKIPAVKASVQPGAASFSGVDEIRASQLPASARTGHYICLASKSARTKATEDYYKALTERIPGAEILPMGSCVKYCTLAEGLADEYTRMGSVMEWDTAAFALFGHAVALDRNRRAAYVQQTGAAQFRFYGEKSG